MWRGYQVAFRQGRAHYEERDASGTRRGLSFDWFPLTQGYRPRGVIRLSPRDTWDLDVPVWARGRRDEIAGRITKDLSSYEGWPAVLMPDAPALDSSTDASVTTAMIRSVVAACPAWAASVVPQPRVADVDRVLLSVPPPKHPSHRLEIVYRRDAVEIVYDCGGRELRAVARFGSTDRSATIFCVCEFLRELREGEMVVVVQRLDLVARRRAGGIRYGAQFRSVWPSGSPFTAPCYQWRKAGKATARRR